MIDLDALSVRMVDGRICLTRAEFDAVAAELRAGRELRDALHGLFAGQDLHRVVTARDAYDRAVGP